MLNKENNTFRATISKEEVNQLPSASFTGEIIVVDDMYKFNKAIKILKTQKLVGLDTETRPSFQKGKTYDISLLQISTTKQCFLFRLNRIGFPSELSKYLSKSKVKKIGLALHDDLIGLQKIQAFKARNFIDLQSIVHKYGIMELSLQKIYAILFQGKISKRQRLSNWENKKLTKAQQQYAATDAWATLMIYKELTKHKKLNKSKIETIKQQTYLLQKQNQQKNQKKKTKDDSKKEQ